MRYCFDDLRVGLVRCSGVADIRLAGGDWHVDEIDLKLAVDGNDDEVAAPSETAVAEVLEAVEYDKITTAFNEYEF